MVRREEGCKRVYLPKIPRSIKDTRVLNLIGDSLFIRHEINMVLHSCYHKSITTLFYSPFQRMIREIDTSKWKDVIEEEDSEMDLVNYIMTMNCIDIVASQCGVVWMVSFLISLANEGVHGIERIRQVTAFFNQLAIVYIICIWTVITISTISK